MLARATVTWVVRATKRVARCLAKGRATCLPAPRPATPRRLRRRIDAACDASSRARVCTRLGCVPCESTADLVACGAAAASTTAGALASPLTAAERGRCRTAVARASGAAASARLGAIVDCADTGATACVPPPAAPDPPADGLARACGAPAADVCAALSCPACASPGELATCVAAEVAEPVDAIASALLGIVR
jgi:hypothetical protein